MLGREKRNFAKQKGKFQDRLSWEEGDKGGQQR